MKKSVSVLALLAATVLFAGCGGCCGGKKDSAKKTESHKSSKPKNEKKVSRKGDEKKIPRKGDEKKSKKQDKPKNEKKVSEYTKLKNDAKDVMKEL